MSELYVVTLSNDADAPANYFDADSYEDAAVQMAEKMCSVEKAQGAEFEVWVLRTRGALGPKKYVVKPRVIYEAEAARP